MDLEFATPKNQEARSVLREQFLRALNSFKGKECIIRLHENTVVEGKFLMCDVDLQEIIIEDLTTPSGLIKHAKLRSGDIIDIQFKENNLLCG